MKLLEAIGAGPLLEQKPDEAFTLAGIEQFPFAQKLFDHEALLSVLQSGDPGALVLDRRAVGMIGEDRADQPVAALADLRGARFELREECGLGFAPLTLLVLA